MYKLKFFKRKKSFFKRKLIIFYIYYLIYLRNEKKLGYLNIQISY